MTQIIKQIGTGIALLSLVFVTSSVSLNAATPGWDVTGSWNIAWVFEGTPYTHEITLVQASNGTLTGAGGHPAGGAWQMNSGSVSGNLLTFSAKYTEGPDIVMPGTILNITGTVASDGTMSGTWSDTNAGGLRTGTWTSISGVAEILSTNTPPVTVPSMKEDCKKGGWRLFDDPSFKNQGQCIKYVGQNTFPE